MGVEDESAATARVQAPVPAPLSRTRLEGVMGERLDARVTRWDAPIAEDLPTVEAYCGADFVQPALAVEWSEDILNVMRCFLLGVAAVIQVTWRSH